MKTIAKTAAFLAITGWIGNAAAIPLGTTDIVTVGGQEWAQANLFTSTSWNAINAQCPDGACSPASAINGYDLDGWTWASLYDVQSLFEFFTGSSSRVFEKDSTWAPEMAGLFDATYSDINNHQVTGMTSTSSSAEFGYAPRFVDNTAPYQYDTTLFFNNAFKSTSYSYIGGWFVRDAVQVPVPTPLALFVLGLASLGMVRRKHAAKV